MSLAEAQRARALEVMDKLSEYSISKMFAQPVDPERDNISGYFDHVKTPMDLGTVRKKLDENVYPSMAAWKDDVELVWSNSLAVHGRTSLLGSITLEMQDVFRKLSQHVTDNPESDWMNKLHALRDELNSLSKRPSSKPATAKKDSKPVQRTMSTTSVDKKAHVPMSPVRCDSVATPTVEVTDPRC